MWVRHAGFVVLVGWCVCPAGLMGAVGWRLRRAGLEGDVGWPVRRGRLGELVGRWLPCLGGRCRVAWWGRRTGLVAFLRR
ncbi:hypothetical protein AQJ91_41830 [Streptomyces dysideae]|uniref:Uncharacterized protein n=1 Tax=Streptomyces dysideae TaxID=909626 RepID=A0A101UR59_9ACTN|nr:hypothetical protein AQJ91_41830 [Streptomyces dysideae]